MWIVGTAILAFLLGLVVGRYPAEAESFIAGISTAVKSLLKKRTPTSSSGS